MDGDAQQQASQVQLRYSKLAAALAA